jgi:hypothetical protein
MTFRTLCSPVFPSPALFPARSWSTPTRIPPSPASLYVRDLLFPRWSALAACCHLADELEPEQPWIGTDKVASSTSTVSVRYRQACTSTSTLHCEHRVKTPALPYSFIFCIIASGYASLWS